MIPPTKGLRFVTGVLFLSRTSSWRATRCGATEVIPVTNNAVGQGESPLEPLRLQPTSDGTGPCHPQPRCDPALADRLLFLAATVLAWGDGQSRAGLGRRPGPEHRWWQVLACCGAGLPVGAARAGELAGRPGADDGARGGSLLSPGSYFRRGSSVWRSGLWPPSYSSSCVCVARVGGSWSASACISGSRW